MHDELRTFRQGLEVASPDAEARVRRRLEAAIRSEGADRRPRARAGGRELLVAPAALAVVVAVVSAATVVPRPVGGVSHEVGSLVGEQIGMSPPHLSERGLRHVRTPRAGDADGALITLPLDGRDAGLPPTYDRGGWSECATSGCYSEL